VELHHLTEYRSAKLRVYFLTNPKLALCRRIGRISGER
jgi:hypothetical protein